MTKTASLDTYQVIARKYRPQTFSDVIGQDPVVTTLKNALRSQRLAHAYLFCGCRGTGKTTLARVFSKALNCHALTADCEPCNQCVSCTEISQGRSLDVIEIDGASHRGIDDIRQINETIGYAPASGKFKIYIIDEVHMLTKEAFNALLKTLEEPPINVKFFFATTEPHKVLATILSRCQRFDLSRIAPSLIEQKLSKIASDFALTYEEEALQMVARLGEGSLRDAESLFDQVICYTDGTLTAEKVSKSLGLVSSSTFFELDEAMASQDFSHAFSLADKIFSSGKELSFFLEALVEHYRTLLALKLGESCELSTSQQKKYATSLELYTKDQCFYLLDYLVSSLQQLSKSSFKRIHLEMLLLHIIRSKHRVPLDTLVRRLKELEQHVEKDPSSYPIKEMIVAQEPVIPVTTTPLIAPEEKVLLKELIATQEEKKNPELKQQEKVEEIAPSSKAIPLPPAQATSESKPSLEVPSSSKPEEIHKEKPVRPQIKHDTIMRFAAVELEGVLLKNQK